LRLDLALIRRHPGLSRRRAQAAIEKGQVKVEGRVRREPGFAVAEAALVDWDPNRPAAPRPLLLPFPVLHQDAHVLVVDKPPGILSVPAPGSGEPSVLGRLLEERPRTGRRPWLFRVHRLDRDTSGALAFALDPPTRGGLIALFRDHRIERRYLALVEGEPRSDQGTIDAPIADGYRTGRRRVARGVEPGRPAFTRYYVRERFRGAALLEVELRTGRQHQIRVHLAHVGLPVLGDAVYRPRASGPPPIDTPRPMLHAFFLGFVHPLTGEPVRARSPLPADFLHVLSVLRRHLARRER
jgi:23S rRNA pseudouridine1911/1915/1917 synthase